MKNNQHLLKGIIIGLLASAIGLVIVLLVFGKGNSIINSLDIALHTGVFTKLMSMGALLNLAAFFLFIKRHEDIIAKGVLIATVVVAILTIIVRFV
ncbi:hypothetical protein ACU8DI_01370 [Psychroserpens sp. BH13MA-6]